MCSIFADVSHTSRRKLSESLIGRNIDNNAVSTPDSDRMKNETDDCKSTDANSMSSEAERRKPAFYINDDDENLKNVEKSMTGQTGKKSEALDSTFVSTDLMTDFNALVAPKIPEFESLYKKDSFGDEENEDNFAERDENTPKIEGIKCCFCFIVLLYNFVFILIVGI